MNAAPENLRFHLRGATAKAHDLLDGTMRAASGWTCRADYARFLRLQYAARQPVEAWISEHAADRLTPPAQTHLIAEDLTALGSAVPQGCEGFFLPDHGDAAALGIAWALAGSALGNRAILKEVRRAAGDAGEEEWPCAFLADPAMLAFWQGLRRTIERPAPLSEAQRASVAAAALFAHFTAQAEHSDLSPAAATGFEARL